MSPPLSVSHTSLYVTSECAKIRRSLFLPGLKFHPTDEELIIHYLGNQAASRPRPLQIIPELDIYKFEPWDLSNKSELCDGEWYFFSPRDRKYPKSTLPNRTTPLGYWKATGGDKAIYSNSCHVGVQKVLVFYEGRPPKGARTDRIVHEYRLRGSNFPPTRPIDSMRLDEWVLCRIYKKKHPKRSMEEGQEDSPAQQTSIIQSSNFMEMTSEIPQSSLPAHLSDANHIWASQLFDEPQFGNQ